MEWARLRSISTLMIYSEDIALLVTCFHLNPLQCEILGVVLLLFGVLCYPKICIMKIQCEQGHARDVVHLSYISLKMHSLFLSYHSDFFFWKIEKMNEKRYNYVYFLSSTNEFEREKNQIPSRLYNWINSMLTNFSYHLSSFPLFFLSFFYNRG